MKSRIAARLGITVGAVSTAAIVATSPAAAITYGYGPWYDGLRGAKVYFEKHGDHVKICDIKTDGERARVVVAALGETRYELADTKNDGKCRYASAANGGDYNLPENQWITFRVYTGFYIFDGKQYQVYNDQ